MSNFNITYSGSSVHPVMWGTEPAYIYLGGNRYRVDSVTTTTLPDELTNIKVEASLAPSFNTRSYMPNFFGFGSSTQMHFNRIRSSFKKLAQLADGYFIKKIIFSDPVTIVFWGDRSKTMVRRSENDRADRKVALIYAIAKRIFGNNTRIHKKIDPFAKTNAQRVAILSYIVDEYGYDIDKIFAEGKISYRPNGKQTIYTF